MYKVYWTNHEYFSQERFNSLAEAKVYVREKFFEALIFCGPVMVSSFTVFGGFRDT